MFHDDPPLDIALGIKEIRKRISAQGVPPSILDKSLNIATWNIREFGKSRRWKASIHLIAEVISQFDLVAITELRSNLDDLRRVLKILGPYWDVVYSDYTQDPGGNRERFGYVFDTRMVVFTGLAAEADPLRKKDKKTGEYLPTITWWRSPYMASFAAGNFDFVLLSAHIRWGKKESDRVKPLLALANWVDRRRRQKDAVDQDIFVMGDFNIPKIDSELYKAIIGKGLRIPDGLLNLSNEKATTNLARNKRYDQILHYPHLDNSFTGNAGVLDYYTGGWAKLFPGNKTTPMKYTFQLSDHLPIWVQLNTWKDDVELDQLIARRRKTAKG